MHGFCANLRGRCERKRAKKARKCTIKLSAVQSWQGLHAQGENPLRLMQFCIISVIKGLASAMLSMEAKRHKRKKQEAKQPYFRF